MVFRTKKCSVCGKSAKELIEMAKGTTAALGIVNVLKITIKDKIKKDLLKKCPKCKKVVCRQCLRTHIC